MSVVRAHGVGVDGVQFSAPRHEATFQKFQVLIAPFGRENGDFFFHFFFQPSQEFKFRIPIPANLFPREAAVRNPFAHEIYIGLIGGGIKKRSFLPFLFTVHPLLGMDNKAAFNIHSCYVACYVTCYVTNNSQKI